MVTTVALVDGAMRPGVMKIYPATLFAFADRVIVGEGTRSSTGRRHGRQIGCAADRGSQKV